MRIICDHCSRPISGIVKRVAGNLNLHPDCVDRSGKEAVPESTAVSGRSQDYSVSALMECNADKTSPSVSQ